MDEAVLGVGLVNSVGGVLDELLEGFLGIAADVGEDLEDARAGMEQHSVRHWSPPCVPIAAGPVFRGGAGSAPPSRLSTAPRPR